MKVALLSIGDELLIGMTLNTDFQLLAKSLRENGHQVVSQLTCADREKEIHSALDYLKTKADFIITTGGLGATPDDITVDSVSKYLGYKVVRNETASNLIDAYFRETGKDPITNLELSKRYPENAEIFPNKNGYACGCYMEADGLKVAVLPGPPKEMLPMFEACVLPKLLNTKKKDMLTTLTYKIFGIRESDVVEVLSDLIRPKDKTIQLTTYCSLREVALVLRHTDNSNMEEVDYIIYEIYNRLGKFIYASEDISLEEMVICMLKLRQKTLAVAESLTGGKIADRLISVPGASEYVFEDIVAYHNDAKVRHLHVSEETLKNHGAVSVETAYEMAVGLLEEEGIDICVATTGIAGPSGGTPEKPVGLTYIAVGNVGSIKVYSHVFKGNRAEVREAATKAAMFYLLKLLVNDGVDFENLTI